MLSKPEVIVRGKVNQRPAGAADAGSSDQVDRPQLPIQCPLLQIGDEFFVGKGVQWAVW